VPAVLITGANRGIGYQHARQYAEQGWQVYACARDPAASISLQMLSQQHPATVRLCKLEVTDHAAVDNLASELRGQAIDVLLNNAGTFGPLGAPAGMTYQSLAQMDYAIWRDILEVNLLAPFKVATAFHEHIAASRMRLLVMMSSGLASIQDSEGHSYAYRSSKAGLNMVTKGMAAEWPDIIVIAMAPGWCKTDLGGADALLDPADSVRDQQQTFKSLTATDSGRFIDMHGQTVPW
jgi:NAD(P)-dependent dehydrogenase (short-subunit alcohol dehydrogenase family)